MGQGGRGQVGPVGQRNRPRTASDRREAGGGTSGDLPGVRLSYVWKKPRMGHGAEASGAA